MSMSGTRFAIPAVIALVLSVGAHKGLAEPAGAGWQPGTASAPQCLSIDDIRQAKAVDPQTIVFRMRDGNRWVNVLHGSCTGLKFDGFVYVTRDQQICANQQSIRVLETRQTCLLGDFSPYTPQAPH